MPQEQFSERICEQKVNVPVPQVDARDERKRIAERLTRIWQSPVPLDKEKFADIRQLVATLSELAILHLFQLE